MDYMAQVGSGREAEKLTGFLIDNLIKVYRNMPWRATLAKVEDTLDQLWGDYKPYIIKSIKEGEKHTFIMSLPPGITYKEFRDKQEYFGDAAGGEARISRHGQRIVLEIFKATLQNNYPYRVPTMEGYLPVLAGYSATGPIVLDISDVPNVLIAGHPGSGKSVLLTNIIVTLLLTRQVEMYAIDLKRGVEFAYAKKYCTVAKDLDKAREILAKISNLIDNRLNKFEGMGYVNLKEYNKDHMELPFVIIAIDELSELQDEDCQTLLNRITRLGRAAGVCVLAATQRPSARIFKDFSETKAMFAATVCYHVRDAINSRMVLGNDRAALMTFIPGRAIYQFDVETEIQTPYLPTPLARKLLKGVQEIEQGQQARRLQAR